MRRILFIGVLFLGCALVLISVISEWRKMWGSVIFQYHDIACFCNRGQLTLQLNSSPAGYTFDPGVGHVNWGLFQADEMFTFSNNPPENVAYHAYLFGYQYWDAGGVSIHCLVLDLRIIAAILLLVAFFGYTRGKFRKTRKTPGFPVERTKSSSTSPAP